MAADTGFADPTGVVGKAVGMVEQIRLTEHTRITRHNVIRGKRDAVKLGRWPGGPPPFGYRLKAVIPDGGAPDEAYSVLEVDPPAAAALRLAFRLAMETGYGEPRENGYAERLMRMIKEEKVALTEYRDYVDARRQLGWFLDDV